jgi:hypothetical protein
MKKVLFAIGIFCGLALSALSAEYYVDNVKGNDANQGTKEAPFKTFEKALKVLKGGDTLHLVHNEDQPYRGCLNINKKYSGTAEKPTVVDGHGALFDGRTVFPASAWKSEGNGIFSKLLKNNAHVMNHRLGCWSGDFAIVFFDGKDGINCRKKEDLKPFSYFLFKKNKKAPLHNTLYIKLPEGKTPDDIKVVTLVDPLGINVGGDYVTIKNVRAQYTGGDCFDSANAKGVVFDNVEGSYAMDQGISHHGTEVTVKNSWFHHNAGCGIVDVWPACRSIYINCLIEDNPYRGGVELLGGEHEMIDCIVRNGSLSIGRKAKAKIKNCLIINGGIICSSPSPVEIVNCTLYKSKKGIGGWGQRDMKISNCAFIDCESVYSWNTNDKIKINSNFNYFAPAKFYINRRNIDFAKYKKLTGQDADSVVVEKYEGKLPPYQTITFGKQKAGADIDTNKIGINSKLMGISKQ